MRLGRLTQHVVDVIQNETLQPTRCDKCCFHWKKFESSVSLVETDDSRRNAAVMDCCHAHGELY